MLVYSLFITGRAKEGVGRNKNNVINDDNRCKKMIVLPNVKMIYLDIFLKKSY